MSVGRMRSRFAGGVAALAIVAVVAMRPSPCWASDTTHDAAVEACIAENSGAGSIDCMKAIAGTIDAELSALEAAFLARAKTRLDADDITETHYQWATSDLQSAARMFAVYVDHQCRAEVGLSGAAGSGSGQFYWPCQIRLKEARTAHMRALLAGRATPAQSSTPSPTQTPTTSP